MEVLSNLGDALLRAGAPLLKDLVVSKIGGPNSLGGMIGGKVIDALAERLGVPANTSDERKPESILRRIEADPEGTAPTIRQVQDEYVKIVDIGTGSLERYHQMLEMDSKSEGILARLWRPFFALVFTLCFGGVVFTVCYLMLNRELSTLNQLTEVTGFLTFAFIAGCAVLGVQVWKRTEEKKSGI